VTNPDRILSGLTVLLAIGAAWSFRYEASWIGDVLMFAIVAVTVVRLVRTP
jgi:hypothetical protein